MTTNSLMTISLVFLMALGIGCSETADFRAGSEVGLGTKDANSQTNGSKDVDQAANISDGKLLALEIQPPSFELAAGTSANIVVKAVYDDGRSIDVTKLTTMSIVEPSVASISEATISALKKGKTIANASFKDVQASASVLVSDAMVRRLELTLANRSIYVDAKTTFQLDAILSDGQVQTVTRQALWSLSEPATAQLGIIANPEMQTNQPKIPLQKIPSLPVEKGVTRIGWDEAVISGLTAADKVNRGIAEAKSLGITEISASYAGITVKEKLAVVKADLLSIRLSSSPSDFIVKGNTVTFKVEGVFADGKSRDITSEASLSFSNTGILVPVVQAPQTFKGQTVGSVNVKASVGSLTSAKTIQVRDASLVSIAIVAEKTELIVGEKTRLKVSGTYSDGATLDVSNHASLVWASDNSQVLSISNDASAKGTTDALAVAAQVIVTASLSGKTNSVTIRVDPDDIKTLEIVPAMLTVIEDNKARFTARGFRTIDKQAVDVTSSVVWSLADESIAKISNASGSFGEVSGLKSGTTDVSALYQGKIRSNKAKLTVVPRKAVAIELTPATATVLVDKTLMLSATVVFNDGSRTANANELLDWKSASAEFATINDTSNNKGRVSGIAQGSSTITATYAQFSVSGTSLITVPKPEFEVMKINSQSRQVQKNPVNLLLAIDNSSSMAEHQQALAGKMNLLLSPLFDSAAGEVAYDLNIYLTNSSATENSPSYTYSYLDGNGNRQIIQTLPALTAGINVDLEMVYKATPTASPSFQFQKGMNLASFNNVKEQVVNAILGLGVNGNPNERLLCNIARKYTEIAKTSVGPLAVLALTDENTEQSQSCADRYNLRYYPQETNTVESCSGAGCDLTFYAFDYDYAYISFNAVDAVGGSGGKTVSLNHTIYNCNSNDVCPAQSSGTCNSSMLRVLENHPQFIGYGNFTNCQYSIRRQQGSGTYIGQSYFAQGTVFDSLQDYSSGTYNFVSGNRTITDLLRSQMGYRIIDGSVRKQNSLKYKSALAWSTSFIGLKYHFEAQPVGQFTEWIQRDVGLGNFFFSAIIKQSGDSCSGVAGSGYQAIMASLGASKSSQASICNDNNYGTALNGISQFVTTQADLQYTLTLLPGDIVVGATVYDKQGNILTSYTPDNGFTLSNVVGSNSVKITFASNTIDKDQVIEFRIRKGQ